MATSANPSMAGVSARNQVIAHASLKVAQMGAMIVPPAYIVSSLILRRGSGFSIRRLMRTTTVGTAVGAGLGAFMGWGRLRTEPQAAIDDRVFRLVSAQYSALLVDVDDRRTTPVKSGRMTTR